VGLDSLAKDWLGDPDLALFSLAGVIIWMEIGFGVILFWPACCRCPRTCSMRRELTARGSGVRTGASHADDALHRRFYLVIEGITLFSGYSRTSSL
jgi:hypothetical protein